MCIKVYCIGTRLQVALSYILRNAILLLVPQDVSWCSAFAEWSKLLKPNTRNTSGIRKTEIFAHSQSKETRYE